MTESQRRAAFNRYFTSPPNPSWPTWFLVLGIPLAILIRESPLMLVFSVMAAVGGMTLISQRRNAVTDHQYDTMREEVLNDLLTNNALGGWHIGMSTLTHSPQTRAIVAPLYPAHPNKHFRVGGDKGLRYTPIRFVIFGFSGDRLYMYGGTRDLIQGDLQDEWWADRDPKSITAFQKTATELFSDQTTSHPVGNTEILELKIPGEPTQTVQLRAPLLAQVLTSRLDGAVPKPDADPAIAALLDALR